MAFIKVHDFEEGTDTDFDWVSFAWDKEADFAENSDTDFDSVTDADGDMATSSDYAYGAADSYGMLYTLDDNNAMFGQLNAASIDRTYGIWYFAFDINDAAHDGSWVFVAPVDGGSSNPWYIYISSDKVLHMQVKDNAGAEVAGFATTALSSGFGEFVAMWYRATSTNSSDGFAALYHNNALVGANVSINNGDWDWDGTQYGMIYMSVPGGESGSFALDDIRIEYTNPGAMWVTKQTPLSGTYSLAVGLLKGDTGLVYGQSSIVSSADYFYIYGKIDANNLTKSSSGSGSVINFLDVIDTTSNVTLLQSRWEDNPLGMRFLVGDCDAYAVSTYASVAASCDFEYQYFWKRETAYGAADGKFWMQFSHGDPECYLYSLNNIAIDADIIRIGVVGRNANDWYGIFLMDDIGVSDTIQYKHLHGSLAQDPPSTFSPTVYVPFTQGSIAIHYGDTMEIATTGVYAFGSDGIWASSAIQPEGVLITKGWTNKIVNPVIGLGDSFGWQYYKLANGTRIFNATDEVLIGPYSLKSWGDGGAGSDQRSDHYQGGDSLVISVPNGQWIVASAWALCSTPNGANMGFYNETGSSWEIKGYHSTAGTQFGATDRWLRQEIRYQNLSGGAENVRVYLGNHGAGTDDIVWFDAAMAVLMSSGANHDAASPPFFYGDMPGCSWTNSTAHESESSIPAQVLDMDAFASDAVSDSMTIMFRYVYGAATYNPTALEIRGANTTDRIIIQDWSQAGTMWNLYINGAWRLSGTDAGGVGPGTDLIDSSGLKEGTEYFVACTFDFTNDIYRMYLHDSSDWWESSAGASTTVAGDLDVPLVNQMTIGARTDDTLHIDAWMRDFCILPYVADSADINTWQSAGYPIWNGIGGAVTKQAEKPISGALTWAGTIIRKIKLNWLVTLSGAQLLLGLQKGVGYANVYKKTKTAVAGVLSTAGAVTKQIGKAVAGALTTAGTITRAIGYNLTGIILPSGEVVKAVGKRAAGAVTFAGTVVKFLSGRVLSGTLTSAGTVTKKTLKSLAGALTSAGVLAKSLSGRVLSGTLTTAGTVVKKTKRTLSGSVTWAGTVVKKAKKVLSGALTWAGTITRDIGKLVQGTLTLTGTVTKALSGRILTGTLGALGAVTKKTQTTKEAVITWTGTITKQIGFNISGAFTWAGTVTKKTGKVVSGVLTSAGTIVKKTSRTLTGNLASAGTVVKKTLKQLAGTLTSIGKLIWRRILVQFVTIWLQPRRPVKMDVDPTFDVDMDTTPTGSAQEQD